VNLDRSEFDEFKIEDNFLKFCSFVCILHGKKLNIANIFLLVLKNQNYRELLRLALDVDTDLQIFRYFLRFDASLSKSKYISKFLNSKEGLKLKLNVYGVPKEDIQRTSKEIKARKKAAISIKNKLRKNK
jgi:glycerol dehydrogenase-like iron-containing ADH family enzyme